MFPPPAIFLFTNAPKNSLENTLHKYNLKPEQWAEWISPYICIVVNTGEHHVLIDTGAGSLAPTTGKLLQNLKEVGITPGDIDIVVLTHGHPDHLGGNTSEGKLTFSNARFVMWKDEWNFWMSEQAERLDEHIKELLIKIARNNLQPIRNQLDLIEQETEIVPGISTIEAAGHTPGHMALTISSEGERLLCIADAFLHPIHIEQPEWHATVDFSPQQVATTRRRLIDKASVENTMVLAFHFPFPGLGHIIQKDEGWRWQPITRK